MERLTRMRLAAKSSASKQPFCSDCESYGHTPADCPPTLSTCFKEVSACPSSQRLYGSHGMFSVLFGVSATEAQTAISNSAFAVLYCSSIEKLCNAFILCFLLSFQHYTFVPHTHFTHCHQNTLVLDLDHHVIFYLITVWYDGEFGFF